MVIIVCNITTTTIIMIIIICLFVGKTIVLLNFMVQISLFNKLRVIDFILTFNYYHLA